MNANLYNVTCVYSKAHGTTQLAGNSKRIDSNRSYFDAAKIVVESGFENSTDGSVSNIVNGEQQISSVTMNGNVYIVAACK